jgi:hypothetical protein
MPATAPILAKPETTLRFGDGDGNSPPKGPCKLFVFPAARQPHWINHVLRAAGYRAAGTSRKPGSKKKGRDAAIEFFDEVLKDRVRELKCLGLTQTQIKREIDSICDIFNEWLARELSNHAG